MISPLLEKHSDLAYAILRIVAGLNFAVHGSQKLFGIPGPKPGMDAALLYTAGIIEFFGGLMIAFGIYAAYAAFLASGQMAFAYFTQHAPGGWLPQVNRGELAVLYCVIFLLIAAKGSGKWSLLPETREKRRQTT